MSVLGDLDSAIATRLSRVKLGSSSVAVRAYSPDRDKGESRYPCYTIERKMFSVNYKRAITNSDICTPSVTNVTVELPVTMGGGTATGTSGYTMKPYPTPVDVTYDIHTLATSKSQYDALLLFLVQSFYPGYSQKIGDDYTLFILGAQVNLDLLELPLFHSAFMLKAAPFWLDRVETTTVPSIQVISFIQEIDTDYVLGITEGV